MPLLSYSQTEIASMIEAHTPDEELRKKLIALLPEFYALVEQSLFLDRSTATELLIAFPSLSVADVQECEALLRKQEEQFEQGLAKELSGDRFSREALIQTVHKARKTLRSLEEGSEQEKFNVHG